MPHSRNEILEKVYSAQTDHERRDAYDKWADSYDRDVTGFGIQLPYVSAAVFARHVPLGTEPVLDAACGTGMHTLPLALMGYTGFHGIDISAAMLAQAEAKQIYDDLSPMALGRPLNLPDNHFEVTYCIGALAHGHAPPESLDELIRVTKPDGLIIWSTHAHRNERTKVFHDYRQSLSKAGSWEPVFETESFISMPDGDPGIQHAIYVHRVIS